MAQHLLGGHAPPTRRRACLKYRDPIQDFLFDFAVRKALHLISSLRQDTDW